MKGQNGITLVALIITVIVMLILAGVAISVLLDGDGLFDTTRNAVEQYDQSVEDESQTFDNLMNYIDIQLWDQSPNNPENQ